MKFNHFFLSFHIVSLYMQTKEEKARHFSSAELCYRTSHPRFCCVRKDRHYAKPWYTCATGDTSRWLLMKCILVAETR